MLPKLIAASGLPAGSFAPPVFGPAGALRQRLLKGERADLFASADSAQPRLVVGAKGGLVVPFARNRMCVIAPDTQGLTQANQYLSTVLDSVDLAVERGALVTLLGPSGCGKTTLLRLIAGLAAPDEGSIMIGGVDAANAASISASFCSSDQGRRRSAPVMTVTWLIAPSLTPVQTPSLAPVLSRRPPISHQAAALGGLRWL